jgi:hypothetical protein
MPDRPYWDAELMGQDYCTPAVLAIGDSWFWYPLGQSLLGPINKVWDGRYCIYAIGDNGAEARDYVDGKFRNIVRDALKGYGAGLSAVLISGGGNDFAGWTDLRRLLRANCAAAASAAECFKPASFEQLFAGIKRYYVSLIMQIQEKCPANVKIVLHNYDYPIPDARGLIGDQRWLKTPMLDRKVPDALMKPCVCHLIDRFGEVMEALAAADPNILVVKSAGCLAEADWANELHPTPGGFAKIAEQRWKPVLRQILP